MSKTNPFIITLTWADGLTLVGLAAACAGSLLALRGLLSLAITSMLLAMLVDMLDGMLARRMKWETQFGRFLDSFCDVFTYLALPLFILYQLGMRDAASIVAIWAFLTAGLLRLSLFNIIGTIRDAGIEYHLGLQVVWSHLLVALAFPAWHWFGPAIRYPVAAILIAMSLLMISNRRFRKPTQYAFLTTLILAVAGAYGYLHFTGTTMP